jgi:hypothetical protein
VRQVSPSQASAGQAVVPQVVVSGCGASLHALVPLQVTLRQSVDAQSTDVPLQLPPKHRSLNVQGSESLHATWVRQAHVPPALVQRQVVPPQLTSWHRVWLPALQVCTAPPPQIPSALAAPQPTQAWPTISWLWPQLSGQSPSVV